MKITHTLLALKETEADKAAQKTIKEEAKRSIALLTQLLNRVHAGHTTSIHTPTK